MLNVLWSRNNPAFLNTDENPVSVAGNYVITFKISGKLNSTEKSRKYEAVVQAENKIFKAIVYHPKIEKHWTLIIITRQKLLFPNPKLRNMIFSLIIRNI